MYGMNRGKTYTLLIRKITAYTCAAIAYALGGYAGAVLGDYWELHAAFPRFIVIDSLWVGSAAFISNIVSIHIFNLVYPKYHRRKKWYQRWEFVLSVLALISGAAALITANSDLGNYSIACFIVLFIYTRWIKI
jgi:hypothetical protein